MNMIPESFNAQHLEQVALRVREHILRMSTDGGCFTGASLSCADLLVYLYHHVLNVSPETRDSPDRDFLLLSKGHDVPALYGVLAELGFFPPARLANHLSTHDHLYWHPNRAIPGVEFHSGSLGHLLSVGLGMALDARMRKAGNRVFVILGDGELNEGSIWEAALVAGSRRTEQLIAIVDRNFFQANMRTEELIPLEPIADKFEAFGWRVQHVDGHDYNDLHQLFSGWVPDTQGRPTVIIAATQRGRGVPSITERADRWFCNFSHEEVESLVQELRGHSPATLTSEGLHVR